MVNKVLIGPSSFAALDDAPMRALTDAGLEVVPNPYGRKYTVDELLQLLPGITGLLAGLEPLDRGVLEKSELKVISRCGSGMSNVDREAAGELGIKVFNTPDGPTAAVAELTVGLLLSLLRQVPQMNASLHGKKWDKRIGRQLGGMVIAIVGFGRIGQMVARLVRPFGADTVAVDPFKTGTIDGTPVVSMEEALGRADAVLLHSSGDETLIGTDQFSIMKDGGYLVNISRGGLVDEGALMKALDSGRVAGAALDTFTEEPYTGPLCGDDRVILTPHVGSYTRECRLSMEMESAENLIKGLK